jgi:hypothetical protein
MPKIKKGWCVEAALYAAVIAVLGEEKTPAFNVATRPAWERPAILRRTKKD